MNPIGSSAPRPVSTPEAPVGSAQERLQISLIKKSLELQRQQATELLRATEQKGQIIDLRA